MKLFTQQPGVASTDPSTLASTESKEQEAGITNAAATSRQLGLQWTVGELRPEEHARPPWPSLASGRSALEHDSHAGQILPF